MRKEIVPCSHKNIRIIQKEETYPVLGENTTIMANVKVCNDCGTELFDFALDEDNLKRAFLKYKRNHALMTAKEICALRNKYNISQRTLATLIGCSQATIVRYENGNIQNNTHNNIMRMLQKPENMSDILAIKEEELSPKEVRSIRKALYNLNASDGGFSNAMEDFGEYLYIKPDRFSGFREFDFYKYIDMVKYFADNTKGRLYKTKLFKMLFYADMYFFREYTKSMSGMNYVHYPYGPVPRSYSFILGLMEKLGAISIVDVENQYGGGEAIVSNAGYSSGSVLAKDEIDILDWVISEFGSLSAGEISDRSHKEKGYIETGDMELISYLYAMEMK